MNKVKMIFALVCMSALCLLNADDTGKKGKAILDNYKDSVVNVSLVLSMEVSYAGKVQPEQEQKIEAQATVFDKSGLLVTAYTNIDPTVAQPKRKVKGRELTIKSSYKEVKLLTANGDEIPLEIVLLDKEQNLAFLRVEKDNEAFKKLELTAAGFEKNPTVRELDHVVGISKLSRSFYRSPVVKLARIVSIVNKPGLKYFISESFHTGTPVYTLDGQLLGLSIPKAYNGKNIMYILPVEEIKEISGQIENKS